MNAFEPLRTSNVALLTTFRASGEGVGTPVGIASRDGEVCFSTRLSTGKVKRLARDPRVTLAPCTPRGKVTGPTVAGRAERLEGEAADRVLKGGGLRGRLWRAFYKLREPGDEWLAYRVTAEMPDASAQEPSAGRAER